MLKVVYDSLTAAAGDLDLVADALATSALSGAQVDFGSGEVAAAWDELTDAWTTGLTLLAQLQRDRASALRQAAQAYAASDRAAVQPFDRAVLR